MKKVKNENLSKLAVKISMYNLFSLFVLKAGGLIFTIIIARMLLPELYGIYALALSIATIILTLTDWGMDSTFARYLSDSVGKGNKKLSRSYNRYFLKIKLSLILFSVILLLVISKYLSYSVYKNPLLFYPLLFSCLFVISEALKSFFGTLFAVRKDFRPIVFFDISSQILEIVLSVFALLIFTDSLKVSGLFMASFVAGILILIMMFFILLKRDKSLLLGETEEFDKSRIKSYWKYMVFVNLSLVFFGSIDTLMLGKFVPSEYLGYYRVAMSLIVLVSSLFSVSGIFLTIFTQIKGTRFKRGFNKILRYILTLSIPATIGIMFIAKYLIKAVYGDSYIRAAFSIYFLSSLILTTPLIGLYQMIFQSKEKPKIVNKSVLFSLAINILLNILAIFLFKNNPLYMVAGVALSTSLSRIFLLWLYASSAKTEFNFRIRGIGLRAPIFATIIMSLFLLAFNHFVNMNLFFGIVEVILGAGIYLIILVLIKGVTKEDFELIKNIFKRK
jgi:O-antigen/teichoic acid export membrane protein